MNGPGAGGVVELELKLALPSRQADRLRRHAALRPISPHRAVVAELDAIYFDTPDLALQAQGIAVRLREAGGHWVQTVKAGGEASGALHRRLEWESPSEGAGLDFSGIDDLALRRRLTAPALAPLLQPVFRTRFRRWARLLVLPDGTRIELALDQGRIEAGGREAPICEVEFELKEGRAEALFELALALQQDLDLQAEPRSKAERGYRLHAGSLEQPARARPPRLQPGQPAALAAAAFLGAGSEQLQRNLGYACLAQDSEFLHQARVALRRLRATFSVFRPLLPGEVAALLGSELRWLMAETGPARDWDVFCTETLPRIRESFPGHPGLAELASLAEAQRTPARLRARSALLSVRSTRLQLELGRLACVLAAGTDGLTAPAPSSPPGPTTPQVPDKLKDFARRRLRRGVRRTALSREQLAGLDDDARHQWRIALKKLRYAAEFLAPVLGRPRASTTWISALSSLQDILGTLNDAATTEALLAGLAVEGAGGSAIALVRGWLAGASRTQLDQLEAARRKLAKSPLPWKD